MATRRTVLDVITSTFKASYDNVTNKIYTLQELIDLKYDGDKFPWVCIGLGPHISDLSLDGFRESLINIPIEIYVYVQVTDQNSLQVALADAMDTVTSVIKNAYSTFSLNCFSVTNIELVPAEDEHRLNAGTLMVVMTITTATSP